MKKQYVPEQAYDEVRACIAKEDNDKFATCRTISQWWSELGTGIIYEKGKEEGWTAQEAKGKAHKWFLSSFAANGGLGYQSMLNRQKVGDNIIYRGYLGGENENISYQSWVYMLMNAEKGSDGLVLQDVLEDRIAWFQETADNNEGQPPSVQDVQNKFQKEGEDPEWLLLWKRIIRVARKLMKLEDTPRALQAIIKSLLSSADVDYIDGQT